MELAYRTELGHVRGRNEDALLVPHPEVAPGGPWVIAVADGMGGHPAGDVASGIAVDALATALGADPGPADLVTALYAAHEAVRAATEDRPDRAGMGTTAVVATIEPGRATLAHVGDSRAYLVRGGSARQLTTDHNRGGYLTQALGHATIAPDTTTVALAPGDRLLLCTDGLTGLVPDHRIGVLAGGAGLAESADNLVGAALTAGGYDNITVILVEV